MVLTQRNPPFRILTCPAPPPPQVLRLRLPGPDEGLLLSIEGSPTLSLPPLRSDPLGEFPRAPVPAPTPSLTRQSQR